MANRWHRARLPPGVALLTAVLGACHPPPPARHGGQAEEPGPVPVRVVRDHGCCKGEQSRLATELEQALGRQPGLRLVSAGPSSQEAHGPDLEARTRDLRATLSRVKDLYLRMQMDAVRAELRRALASVKQLSGAHLEAQEIATIHLYLAAISQATGQTGQLRHHAEAAVRFFPELRPDPDIFTPPVRAEIEKARQARQTVDVTVVSEPPGARVIWDGTPRGETPAQLRAQAVGEHYLRLQRAGDQPWHDTIVLSRASAELQVKLKSAGAPTSLPAADVLVVSAAGDGLRVVLQPRSGSPRTAGLKRGAAATDAERVVVELLVMPASEPGPTTVEQPRPAARRSHWQRYWWAYAVAGTGALILGIALPVAIGTNESNGSGRSVRLPLP